MHICGQPRRFLAPCGLTSRMARISLRSCGLRAAPRKDRENLDHRRSGNHNSCRIDPHRVGPVSTPPFRSSATIAVSRHVPRTMRSAAMPASASLPGAACPAASIAATATIAIAMTISTLPPPRRPRRRHRDDMTTAAGRPFSPVSTIAASCSARAISSSTAISASAFGDSLRFRSRNFAHDRLQKNIARRPRLGNEFPRVWGDSGHVHWGVAAVGSAALCGRASRSPEDGVAHVSPIPVRGGSAGAFSKVRRGAAPCRREDRRSSRGDSVSPAANLLLSRLRAVHDAGPIDCAIGPASAAGHLALRGLRQDRNDRMPSLVRQQA